MSEPDQTGPALKHRKAPAPSRNNESSDDASTLGSQDSASRPRFHRRKKSFINVAPLNTPLARRLQTLSVMWHTISIPFFCCLFLFLLYLGTFAWIVVIVPYFIWFYGFDLHTPTNGKSVYRVRDWMRNLILWDWFVSYFPITLHKTCDLEPTFTTEWVDEESSSDDEQDLISEHKHTVVDKIFSLLGLRKRVNDTDSSKPREGSDTRKMRRVATGPRYIFGYHPHGVISMGVMGMFATNVIRNEPFEPPLKYLKSFFHDPSKGERTLAGLGHVFPLTLTEQFTIPFFRDYLLSLGLTSASSRNIKSLVNNGDNSVCIVVGGAQESLLNDMVGSDLRVGIGYDGVHEGKETPEKTEKKEIRLVLHKRKGFVKLAIEMGNICLVPVFGFGEADVYRLNTPSPGSFGHSFQQWMKRHFHFTLPFFSARGVFIYDFGFLPYRTPINIVMGQPIYVPSGLLSDDQEAPSPLKEKSPSFTNLLRKKSKPTARKVPQDLLDHYHRLYVEELKNVYEKNKHKFGYGDVELNIIE